MSEETCKAERRPRNDRYCRRHAGFAFTFFIYVLTRQSNFLPVRSVDPVHLDAEAARAAMRPRAVDRDYRTLPRSALRNSDPSVHDDIGLRLNRKSVTDFRGGR